MNKNYKTHQTSDKDKLSIYEKLSYGSGSIPFAFAYMGINQLALPIFNITLEINATLIGVILGLGRLWDAFSDPMMGNISDNARTRWGRRRPFILLGGLLCGITFPIVFFVPIDATTTLQFTWLLVGILMLYTASTVYSVPWLSLSYELSPDSLERVRIQVYRAYVGGLVSLSLPWFYRFAQADFFGSTIIGIRWIAIIVGLCFVIFSIPVFIGCKERYMKTVSKQNQVKFLTSLKEVSRNRPFLLLVLGIVTSMLCAPMLVGSLGIYINIYYVFEGDTKAGASLAAAGGSLFVIIKYIIIPVTLKLSSKYGKIQVMHWALLIGLIGSISKFFFYTPDIPYLQFGSILLMGPAITAFWLLVDPMKADCADYDEHLTGMRREGTYAAVANWIEKMSITLVMMGSGAIIDLSGFDPQLGGNQAESTLLIMRGAFAFVPSLAFITAIICLHFYSLNEEKMYSIRRDLEQRRGEIN